MLADETVIGSRFRYYILINSSLPPLRQRFTIAHEFGHIMLDHLNENVRCQTFIGREDANIVLKIREREANIFAPELLMPEELFRQYHKEGATLIDLSQLFKVSLAAAKIRLEELGLYSIYD